MNSLIISNSTAKTATATNEIRIDFTQAPLILKNQEVALAYLGLYYSWRNITSAYGNNSFSYLYNGTNFPIDLPDGFYSIEDLNNFMQIIMHANNHFMLDTDSEPVYFISMAVNEAYYAVTFVLDVIAVPSGGTNPNSLVLGSTCQIVIPNTAFTSIVGMTAGTYPATSSATVVTFNSTNVPSISPVTSVHVTTNVSTNDYNQFRDTIYTFSPVSSYASFLTINPNYPIWYRVIDGSYSYVSIRFYDQEYRPLELVDKFQITSNLLFKKT